MQSFRNFKIMVEIDNLVLEIYAITKNYPREEIYGVVQQMRRAATSIGANIAEGAGRKTDADFQRFLFNSMGSLKELEYFVELSKKLGYLKEEEYSKLCKKAEIVGRMLNNFIKSLSSANGQ
ncbi:TPA: four helix bundle protein [archaeon]|nr:four helix bundle protein [Candidatus Naiadarchaeales archaeon SRR2090153.bin461]HIK02398.1 four helix bundle protein [Candidatus Naiadarchaeales archaeon SRR2090159.bin1288]